MKNRIALPIFLLLTIGLSAQVPTLVTGAQEDMSDEWIDASTGHKVMRISRRAGRNRSFYFHNDPFLKTTDGQQDLMVFYGTTEKGNQLFTLNLQTLETTQLTDTPSRKSGEIVGDQRREVFFQVQDSIFAVHVDTRKLRKFSPFYLSLIFLANKSCHTTTLCHLLSRITASANYPTIAYQTK